MIHIGQVLRHMHICIRSIQIYFHIFFHVFVYHYPFTVHTLFQFFLKFSLFFFPLFSVQKPVTLTWHSWFCFHLSTQVDIHINIWVDINNWVDIITKQDLCIGWNQNKDQQWFHKPELGICGLRHSLTFPSSVFWQSLGRWEPIFSILLIFLINCIGLGLGQGEQ